MMISGAHGWPYRWKIWIPAPICVPLKFVARSVRVKFSSYPPSACPNNCHKLDADACFLQRRVGFGPGGGAKIAVLDAGWGLELIDPVTYQPKHGFQFGSNVVDGFLRFDKVPGHDAVKVEVRTVYDPGEDYVCTYDHYEPVKVVSGVD